MLLLFILFYISCGIFWLVTLWKFAIKTGRKGWELYIPIYSNYVLLKIAGLNIYWFLITLLPLFVSVIFYEYPVIILLSIIPVIYVSFKYCSLLSKKFNKDIGFAFGLFLLNSIFMCILAFDKKCIYNK